MVALLICVRNECELFDDSRPRQNVSDPEVCKKKIMSPWSDDQIRREPVISGELIFAASADLKIPRASGFCSILVDTPNNLSEPFADFYAKGIRILPTLVLLRSLFFIDL